MFRAFARLIVAGALLSIAAGTARAAGSGDADADRIFGVLPNYTTVDTPAVPRLTTRASFRMASLGTFDPVVYPFIAVTTMLGQGGSDTSFGTRYATAFADNAIGNFMTTAVMPSLTGEDSRYFRRGEGGVFSRLAYAASRTVVTRTRDGRETFNISEVSGTFAAASLSNIYYSPADRTTSATLSRWGTQVMWDTVANELKEFWPDVRARLRRK